MHRERIKWLSNPIVLVGGSRVQVDFNLKELENLTGREVVQLAIDGQYGMPILEHFANDESFKGTLIVSLQDNELFLESAFSETLKTWLANYEKQHSGTISPNIEALLQGYFQLLYSYHSIEMDVVTLIKRLFTGTPVITYLKTDINRERFADYKKIPYPQFYVNRVIRHLGYMPQLPDSLTLEEFNNLIRREIVKIKPYQKKFLERNLRRINMLTKKLEKRGNAVIIIRMPTDKLVLDIDNARSSHIMAWANMHKMGIKSLHFSQLPDMDKFSLPDGSHLDQSQKKAFTKVIVAAMKQRGWLGY